MPQQQTKQGEYYYHIPLSQQEAFLFSKTTDTTPRDFYTKFFKDVLTSKRPSQIYDTTYITMSRSSMSPNKVYWKRFDDGDKPSLQTYNMVSKDIVDELERYRKKNPKFSRFDRNIMRPKISASSMRSPLPSAQLFHDKILGHLQDLQHRGKTSVPQPRSASDPYAAVVFFLLVVMGLAFFYRRDQVNPLMEDANFTNNIQSFIQKVENQQTRKKFQEFFKELQQKKKSAPMLEEFQGALGNKAYADALVRYLDGASRDDTILQGTAKFLATLPQRTKNRFVRTLEKAIGKKVDPMIQTYYKEFRKRQEPDVSRSILPSTSSQRISVVQKQQKDVSIQKEKQPPKPTTQSILGGLSSLFFKENKQLAVSPMGTMSPHFAQTLKNFLKKHGATDPEEFKEFIHHHARQQLKKNPAIRLENMNNKLSALMTTQMWDAYKERKQKKEQQKEKITKSTKTRKGTQQEEQFQKQQQLQKEQQQQFQKEQHLMPVVHRLKKPKQTAKMAEIMDTNMENILGSKKYKKAIATLTEFLENHPQIQRIFVVDAPNLLFTEFPRFRKRQQTAASPEFVSFLRQTKDMDLTDMIIIVSQMNLRKWILSEDPVIFNHILNDRENIFHLQVGCADTTTPEIRDCFGTIGSNEMDDFVRHDLMTRLAYRFKDRKVIELSNDKGQNWQLVETYLKK